MKLLKNFQNYLQDKNKVLHLLKQNTKAMRLKKTSEKVLIWMHRNNVTQSDIASRIGITRQTWAKKMKDNSFEVRDIIILKSMGFDDKE